MLDKCIYQLLVLMSVGDEDDSELFDEPGVPCEAGPPSGICVRLFGQNQRVDLAPCVKSCQADRRM